MVGLGLFPRAFPRHHASCIFIMLAMLPSDRQTQDSPALGQIGAEHDAPDMIDGYNWGGALRRGILPASS